MPVGTQGSVKAALHRDLEDIGASIILGNTYHLFLRPGDELIARRGGLHRFIGWERPILTDSGGFQVFSMVDRRTIREEGAEFRSHLDGSPHMLSPERATDIQARLGSDIAMVLDACLAFPATPDAGAVQDARPGGPAAAASVCSGFAPATPRRGPSDHADRPFGTYKGASRTCDASGRHRAVGFEGYALAG